MLLILDVAHLRLNVTNFRSGELVLVHWYLEYKFRELKKEQIWKSNGHSTLACFKYFRNDSSSGSKKSRARPLAPALAVRPTL